MIEGISLSERRSFLARLSAGVTAFAAVLAGKRTIQGQSVAPAKWQAERHEKDDWLDRLPGKHRLVFDTTTPDGLGDAIAFASNFMRVNRTDYGLHPKTKIAPKVNVYNSADYGAQLPNRGTTLDSLLKQGVQLAVCQVATRGIAGTIAEATGNTDAIYNELVASIGSGARMVPAGIVAVNRAQERGYSFVSA
jgi:intracellular sulfur oxidation DsrE/DsrF family protein